jgi:thymidylate kinase
MYKVSIVGIDNTGKTSIVSSLAGMDGIDTIHLTAYQNHGSRIARVSGRAANGLAVFGERNQLKHLTGFAYLLHLFPYYFEERNKTSSILVSDRDPIIDTLCYSDFYLPDVFSGIARSPLKLVLEHVFNYPSSFLYLEASPEVSARRNTKPGQLHDEITSLNRLKQLFDEEIFRVEREGTPVFRIDTDIKPLEEIAGKVRQYLAKLSTRSK